LLVDRTPLSAFRVNLSRKSDSIITEIVQNIAQCRLVLTDISTTGWSRSGVRRSRPIRNSNVMYELGIAHAARLPEEVIIVRADADHLTSTSLASEYTNTPLMSKLLEDGSRPTARCARINRPAPQHRGEEGSAKPRPNHVHDPAGGR
jgi:hypothetical protein